MKIGITILASALALSHMGSVLAAEPSVPPAPESPADKLANMQTQKALNKVRLDIATQEMELAKLRTSAQPAADSNPESKRPAAPRSSRQERAYLPAPAPTPAPAPEQPRLVSIVGMADKLRATILTAGGATVTALEGDALDGGWVVRDIEATSVTVAHGTRVVVLKP
jgi:type IV pilus biogenesis protein PilP